MTNNNNLRGIGLMLLAMATLAALDASMKHLVGYYPSLQVAALRGIISLPFILLWVYWRQRSFRTLLAVRWRWHIGRGVLAVLMLTSFIYALRQLPLSEAYSLFFVAPLLITALSVPLLGEQVGIRRWSAVFVGFCGVLIVLRPGQVPLNLTTLAVLVGATCYALNAVSVRILGRTDSTEAMTFWFLVMLATGATALALPEWRTLEAEHTGWLLAMGLFGALGQVFLTAAFRSAPISIIAPFEYTSLFWGVLFDLVIWHALPDPIVFVGAAVIVGSGLYLIHRERRPSVVTPP